MEEYFTNRHSSFIEDILAEPLLDKLKMPQLTQYEGKEDPFNHIDNYSSCMELQWANDAIMCRAFLVTLGR